MSNPETLKVLKIESIPSHSGKGKIETVFLSKLNADIPVAQLPIDKNLNLKPGTLVEVTAHTTLPNENGGTLTTYEVSPQK